MIFKIILVLIISYLLGSVPSAYIVGKLFCNINIMEHGSGNVGATNTFRVLGAKYGILVFVIDVSKGFFAAMLGSFAGGEPLSVFTGLTAVFGHTFSVFLHFKGGKGVATGAGTILWWCPPAIGCALLVWLLILILTGYVSVSSLIATACCFVFLCIFGGTRLQIIVCFLIVLYVFWKHRSNLSRLINGTENRMDRKKYLNKILKR